ncbi:MAG: hypothetical protein M3Q76_05390 [Acidobacteriota bacterium]|nr:hypothetical protein [Acidobacteriota bacterium]
MKTKAIRYGVCWTQRLSASLESLCRQPLLQLVKFGGVSQPLPVFTAPRRMMCHTSQPGD